MDEEPKSIWKKSWTGWGWLRAWLVLVVAMFVIFTIVFRFIPGGPQHFWDLMPAAGVYSLVLACVVVGLWAFIRCLFCWRNSKRLLFGLVCFATLIALFYAEEDWRGRHAWNQFKHQWEAKGEKFDWQSVVPPPVPDDKNFAFSPVCIAEIKQSSGQAEKWYGDRIYSETVSNLLPQIPIQLSGLTGKNWWSMNPLFDLPDCSSATNLVGLSAWQSYYRSLAKTNPAAGIPISAQPQSPAADVLLALSKYDSAIEREREDSRREYSRFPISYDDANPASIALPHLGAVVRRHTRVLQLRAIAEIENYRPDLALDDVKLMLRLIDSVKDEPLMISQLVRAVSTLDVIQVVGQGLVEHRWSVVQLTELDLELAKFDLLSDSDRSLKSEMAFTEAEINYLRRSRDFTLEGINSVAHSITERFLIRISRHTPDGWFYQSSLRHCRVITDDYLPAVDVNAKTISPRLLGIADKSFAAADAVFLDPLGAMSAIMGNAALDSIGNILERIAASQSSVDLARVAIALERYRLAHGEYPESLDVLAPQFIEKVPHDVIGGGPLHYRRDSPQQSSGAASGQFVLYSVGWNETDDGGVVAFQNSSQPRDEETKSGVDINQGDWVWRYPAK